ncbi:MAG: hypothetical protein UY03_C0010G0011 [Parcubacteria group bacterium GW2011_GWA2_47_64]|nr:MAG: hypothetical protein UY03_C0010G0011 [Parcubacteria group bacterium GW2011_GWA2_47_64]KKU97141.1 MAG: hypothetical protein UY29_C0002G0038 [Parcubacteria group bacterium GW2011_GWC2_48_17]
MQMQKTIIVLITLTVALIFYWQFFVPSPAPAAETSFPSEQTGQLEADFSQ